MSDRPDGWGNIEVVKTCPSCGMATILAVHRTGWDRWQSGAHIQDAFPELDVRWREALISGLCFDCQPHRPIRPKRRAVR